MGLLRLDKNRLELNMILGVLEEYKPDAKMKRVQERLARIREKYSAKMAEVQELIQKDITPELEAIEEEVTEINNSRYPQLEKLEKGKTVTPSEKPIPIKKAKSKKKSAKK